MLKKNSSLECFIKPILSKISGRLIGDDQRSQIAKICTTLPALQHGIFELYELPYDPRVDLMVCVFAEGERTKLDQWLSQPTQYMSNTWTSVDNFIKLWDTNGHLTHNLVNNIYLVFDNKRAGQVFPEPWIYLAFHQIHLDAITLFGLYRQCTNFIPGDLAPSTLRILQSCFEMVASPAWIFGFGFLRARGSQALRIGIGGFKTIQGILTFLGRIHWEGNLTDLESKIGFMQGIAQSYVLALDIGTTILPRIGIECELSLKDNYLRARHMIQATSARWPFDHNRAEAMCDWIGTEDLVSDNGCSFLCNRWLNHIKLIYAPKQPMGIKPYLYYHIAKKH